MPERTLRPWPYTPAPHLVADTGGTNTRVALADSGVLRQGSIRRYANAGHGSLSEILSAFLRDTATTECAGVCVAVAGPVRDGHVRMTNLDWDIDTEDLARVGRTRHVALLNDLQAQGHALSALDPRHVVTLSPGDSAPEGAVQLVVGAGTGFNAAAVLHDGARVLVTASECGHMHLPQQTEDEQAFARVLVHRHGVATVEEALSGRGLVALHHWTSGHDIAPDALIAAIAAGDAQARETGRLYARFLARTLASLGLVHLPYGGIYLIGGVARAMAPHLLSLGFLEAYREMGRYSALVEALPIRVIQDDYAALLGCATYLAAP
ncbi:glucokinase [Pararhodobacter sp.]